MTVPNCTSYNAIMMVNGTACSIKTKHKHYAHPDPDLFGFEHSVFLEPTFLYHIHSAYGSNGNLIIFCVLKCQQNATTHESTE